METALCFLFLVALCAGGPIIVKMVRSKRLAEMMSDKQTLKWFNQMITNSEDLREVARKEVALCKRLWSKSLTERPDDKEYLKTLDSLIQVDEDSQLLLTEQLAILRKGRRRLAKMIAEGR
jgi:hypothetical protein